MFAMRQDLNNLHADVVHIADSTWEIFFLKICVLASNFAPVIYFSTKLYKQVDVVKDMQIIVISSLTVNVK